MTVPVELIDVHRPALDFEQMFRTMHCLVTEHRVGLPPKEFRSAVLVGMLFTAYERENVTVEPPALVMATRCAAVTSAPPDVPDARVPTDDDRHHTGDDHPHCSSSGCCPMLRVVTD